MILDDKCAFKEASTLARQQIKCTKQVLSKIVAQIVMEMVHISTHSGTSIAPVEAPKFGQEIQMISIASAKAHFRMRSQFASSSILKAMTGGEPEKQW